MRKYLALALLLLLVSACSTSSAPKGFTKDQSKAIADQFVNNLYPSSNLIAPPVTTCASCYSFTYKIITRYKSAYMTVVVDNGQITGSTMSEGAQI